MSKIEVGKKDSAILQAKTVAYRDAYLPKGLGKVVKIKFSAKTGRIQIVGRSHWKTTVSAILHGLGPTKVSKNISKSASLETPEK